MCCPNSNAHVVRVNSFELLGLLQCAEDKPGFTAKWPCPVAGQRFQIDAAKQGGNAGPLGERLSSIVSGNMQWRGNSSRATKEQSISPDGSAEGRPASLCFRINIAPGLSVKFSAGLPILIRPRHSALLSAEATRKLKRFCEFGGRSPMTA